MADNQLLTLDSLATDTSNQLMTLDNLTDGSSNQLMTLDNLANTSNQLMTLDSLVGGSSEPTYSPDYADSTGNKWDIATDSLAASAYDGIGLIADLIGADDTAAEWRKEADRYQKIAASRPKPTISMSVTEEVPDIIDKFSDGEIGSAISDSAELVHSLMVGVLPSLGASIGGLAVGALAAPVLGTVGIPAALTTAVGMMAPGYLLSSGSIYDEAKEQGASEEAAKTAAVGGGVLVGALDRLGMGYWLKGISDKLGKNAAIDTVSNLTSVSKKTAKEALETAEELTKKSTIKETFKQFGKNAAAATAGKEVVKEFGKGTAKGSIGEGITEAGQEAVQIASAAIAGDKTLDAISTDSAKKIIDSLAMGIAAGPIVGAVQGATAPIRKEAERKAVEIEQLNDRLAKASTDYEKELILGERTALTEGRKFRTGLEEEMPGVDLGPKFAELGKLQKELDDIAKVKGSSQFSINKKKKKLNDEFDSSGKRNKLNNLKEELRFKKQGIGAGIKKLVTRSTSVLEGFANRTPVARAVVNDLNNIINNTNKSTGDFARIKTLVLDPLRKSKKLPFQRSIDKNINNELYKELGTKQGSSNLEVKEIGKQIRERILNPIFNQFKELGSELGYLENYLPVIVKPFGIGKKGKRKEQEFIKVLNNNNIDGRAYIEKVTENDGTYRPDNSFAEIAIEKSTTPKAQTIGIELERALPLNVVEELASKGLIETDVEKLLNKYIVQSMRNIEVKKFANKHNPNISEFLNSGLMQESEARQVKKVVDGLQNNFNNIKDKNMRKAYKFLLTGTYIATLGLAAIPSLVEPFVVLTKVNPKNALFGAFKALNVARRKGIRTFKPKFPRSQDELALMSLMQTSDMALNDSIRDLGDTVYSKRITDKFFKFNLLAQVTQFSRNVAFQAGRLQIRDDIKRLEREGLTGDVTTDSSNARKRLLELGLINPVSRSKDKGTTVQEDIAGWANSIETDTPLDEPPIITKALGKLVNEVIMTPDALNKPLWMSDPRLAPVAQLKGFATVFGNTVGMKVYKDIFIPLQQGRIPAADIMKNAIFFTLLVTAIMGTQAFKDALKYGDKESPFDKLDGWEKILYAIKQSQIFGYGGIIMDSLDAEKYGSSTIESLIGPGPTLATRTASGIASGIASGKPKKIAKAIGRLVPEVPLIPYEAQPRTLIKESMD